MTDFSIKRIKNWKKFLRKQGTNGIQHYIMPYNFVLPLVRPLLSKHFANAQLRLYSFFSQYVFIKFLFLLAEQILKISLYKNFYGYKKVLADNCMLPIIWYHSSPQKGHDIFSLHIRTPTMMHAWGTHTRLPDKQTGLWHSHNICYTPTISVK